MRITSSQADFIMRITSSQDDFIMRITSSQADFIMRITSSQADFIMNSKSEFHQAPGQRWRSEKCCQRDELKPIVFHFYFSVF